MFAAWVYLMRSTPYFLLYRVLFGLIRKWTEKENNQNPPSSNLGSSLKKKSTWMMWQGWGFLVISNTGKKQNFLQERRNKWNQVQQPFTSGHQMQRFESGSKSEGSIQSLLQYSEVSFEKKYIYLGTKAHKKTQVTLITKRDMKIHQTSEARTYFLPFLITCCCRTYPFSLSYMSKALTEPFGRQT